jgi:hypothetical protein
MLLGHASHLGKFGVMPAEQLLIRIYGIASLQTFPDAIYFELTGLEDDYALARDNVLGTLEEVAKDVSVFFAQYEPYAPEIPITNG